jgi:hypothetical protein
MINMDRTVGKGAFEIMGLFVMVIWLMNLLAAVLLIVQRLPDLASAWALRLGLLLTLVGLGVVDRWLSWRVA